MKEKRRKTKMEKELTVEEETELMRDILNALEGEEKKEEEEQEM